MTTQDLLQIPEEKIEKLRLVFNALTAHMRDWKQSFHVYANQVERDLYIEAITWHVGGEVKVFDVTLPHSAPRFLLITDGYYHNMGEGK